MSIFTVLPTDMQVAFNGVTVCVKYFDNALVGVQEIVLLISDPVNGWVSHGSIVIDETALTTQGPSAYLEANLPEINTMIAAWVSTLNLPAAPAPAGSAPTPAAPAPAPTLPMTPADAYAALPAAFNSFQLVISGNLLTMAHK